MLIFTLTVAVAAVTAWLLMDLPGTESELPWPDLTRDVVYERQAVDAALGRGETPDDHARTPGAVVVLLPLALVPSDYVTLAATIVSVISVGLVAAGAVRLRQPSSLIGLVLAAALPVSVAFIQAVFHGSTFVSFAACLIWAWVFLKGGKPMVGGLLLAVAGVSRLWPFLLLVVLVRRKQTTAALVTSATAIALTVGGLSLPGITISGSLATLVDGGEGWIAAEHNGSLASWLVGLGAVPAAVVGLGLVLALWWFGLRRSRSLDTDIGWTLPAAVFASPLAWLPYLLALAPLLLVRPRSRLTIGVIAAIGFVQLVGYRLLTQQVSMTMTLLLIGWVAWNECLGDEDADLGSESGGRAAVLSRPI